MKTEATKKLLLNKLLSIFIVFNLTFGCAVNPVTKKPEFIIVSESQEIEMGRNYYQNAIWDAEGGGGEFKSPELTKYLEQIVNRIHEKSHRPNIPIKFAIQNSSIPNAWAIPGYVVITRGLLANLESEAEFAYIMGHEIGHISARHSAKQISYGFLAQIGLVTASMFLYGKDYANLALEAGALGSSLLLLKYSRDDELEADRLGIYYMTAIGYKPENAISAHQNLEKAVNKFLQSTGKGTRENSFLQELLSTHPRNSIRVEELRKMEREFTNYTLYGDGTNKEVFLKNTERLRLINRAYVEHYDKAYNYFRQGNLTDAEKELNLALGIDQTQPAFYTLKALIFMKQGLYDLAKNYLKIALDLDKDYQPAIRAQGFLSYSLKNYIDSAKHFENAIKLYPGDFTSHYYGGLSFFELGNYHKAKNYFVNFANAFPKHPEIHGYLGICYEKLGDIKSAMREYSLQVEIAPHNTIGKKAQERLILLKKIVR
jgi:predicted Zn-dependent protease